MRTDPYRARSSHSHLLLLVGVFGLLPAGCAGPVQVIRAPRRIETPGERYARQGERIAENPLAFLREVAQRTAKLDEYRLTFYRQERLGLPPQLGPMEEIQAAFRRKPFSVKFEWESKDMPYYESVYVEGENENQLLIRERKGLLPFLPPTVRSIDVMLPVKLGKSKNPITDFGLERMVQRTLLPFEDPEVARQSTTAYEGVVNLEPMNRPAYHIRITRPKLPGLNYTRQDLYFDAQTLLPAGTDLYLPNDVLGSRYRYANVRTDVNLTDADFRLSKGHPATQPAKSKE